MVDRGTWFEIENGMIGVRDAPRNVEDLEREVRRKHAELEELYRKIQEAKAGTARRRSPDDICIDLRKEYPFLELEYYGSNSVPGTDVGFNIKVSGAPFHIFNGSGTALQSTLPMNDMTLRVSQRGVQDFSIDSGRWVAIANELPDRTNVNVSADHGHPHCSMSIPEGMHSLTTSVHDLCFGSGDRRDLAANIDSQAKLILCVKGLYAWLTELNTDSTYHDRVAPIQCKFQYVMSTIKPACQDVYQLTKEVVSSPGYIEAVKSIREERFTGAQFLGCFDSIMSVLFHEKIQPTLIGKQAQMVRTAQSDGSRVNCLHSFIGYHLLLSSILIFGCTERARAMGCMTHAASSIAACLGTVWRTSNLRRRMTVPGPPEDVINYAEPKRFVANLETMQSGSYGREY